jgi:hypothetical protein
MMEKNHPNRTSRRNKMRRRDIPNPLTILQVPKILQIPRRRIRGKKFTYCNKPNHEEFTCMKK